MHICIYIYIYKYIYIYIYIYIYTHIKVTHPLQWPLLAISSLNPVIK